MIYIENAFQAVSFMMLVCGVGFILFLILVNFVELIRYLKKSDKIPVENYELFVEHCTSCGKNHWSLFRVRREQTDEWTHWSVCPNTGYGINMKLSPLVDTSDPTVIWKVVPTSTATGGGMVAIQRITSFEAPLNCPRD